MCGMCAVGACCVLYAVHAHTCIHEFAFTCLADCVHVLVCVCVAIGSPVCASFSFQLTSLPSHTQKAARATICARGSDWVTGWVSEQVTSVTIVQDTSLSCWVCTLHLNQCDLMGSDPVTKKMARKTNRKVWKRQRGRSLLGLFRTGEPFCLCLSLISFLLFGDGA